MPRRPWFLLGLFATTLATLCLEVLDTRLLSVMAWYHLSFFAVSTAMFGMAAGALRVYLGGAAFEGDAAPRALVRHAYSMALATPLCHLGNLVIPLREGVTLATVSALLVTTLFLAVPFYLSGVVVTLALTRIPGRIGLAYAVDLAGAALGALLVMPVLEWSNLSSGVLLCAASAGFAAVCFERFAAGRWSRGLAVLSVALAAAAVVNVFPAERLRIWFPKGKAPEGRQELLEEHWNIHSQVMLIGPPTQRPQYWGPGEGTEKYRVEGLRMVIDGNAGTNMAHWDGDPESLTWVRHDVTSLPYHLRRGGDAAVIGVGGGRDLLTALWAQSASVKGIEINKVFLDLLEGPRRDWARLADRPEVTLVHDEARSYLTRTRERYDVLQMSLIDTWAATGAGAFSLTENGLYTLEAWEVFLRVLKPEGIFSVSRWFDSENASETSRLLALATAALLERGVEDPARHLILVACKKVATLLVSPSPFSDTDLGRLRESVKLFGFQILVAPQVAPALPALGEIVASTTRANLDARVRHDLFDYSPPTDERPFFFNFLRPTGFFRAELLGGTQGVLSGNLKATGTLLALFGISLVLVCAVILGPLLRSGFPAMSPSSFGLAVAYFASIGFGFMLVQIPYMQRFSVYLGHPTYAVVIILFSMILMTGVGSLLSDRLPAEASPRVVRVYPLAIAGFLLLVTFAIQPVIDATIRLGLFARCLVVIALVAPVSVLLGLCFPIGMRLVKRVSDDAAPWMWGVNGACGVVGAVLAVGVSIWAGIDRNLFLAAGLYAALAVVAPELRRRGRAA